MFAVQLKEILDSVRVMGDLKPIIDKAGHVLTTFCNLGLDRIFSRCGVPRMLNKLNLQILTANAMCERFANSPSIWEKVTGDVACARASQGILVVACQRDDTFHGHGHVAAVYPRPMEFSGSWGKLVPMLCNIGRPFTDGRVNCVLRASQCFRKEPDYYSIRVVLPL